MNAAFFFRVWKWALGFFFLVMSGTTSSAQDQNDQETERSLLLERIRIDSDSIVVFDDAKIVATDVSRMLKDVGLGSFAIDAGEPSAFDVQEVKGLAPGYATSDFFDGDYQYYIKSPDDLAKSIGVRPHELNSGQLKASTFNELKKKQKLISLLDESIFNEQLIESSDLFLADNKRKDHSKKAYQWKIGDKLLWPSLDERTRAIILQSPVSVVSHYEPKEYSPLFEKEQELLLEELSPAEREWFDAFNDVLHSSSRQVLGLKYHERMLEVQARIQIGKDKSFDSLVRPNTGKENWRPDLGLEREQLVFASAIQMNAFPSSAPIRTIRQIGLIFGSQQYQWLEGNMLGTLTELVGDSWNDLTAARIALYENEESESNGWLSIIGVVDSKDPTMVLRELERMSKLTSPEAPAEKGRERDEEIARLIADLVNPDSNVAGRAEARLRLAGRAAVPALKEVANSDNEELKRVANRILRRVTRPLAEMEDKIAISAPGFWTTLNPGLRFEQRTGKVLEFQVHTIHISPDPSKSELEVAEASRLMEVLFGPKWQTIQVIEVGQHFVFMVGSDQALLERVVVRVPQGVCELSKDLEGIGNCNRRGPLQFWVHGYRFGNLVQPDMVRFRIQNVNKDIKSDLQPIWGAIDFNGQGLEMKALATPSQIRGAMGF